MVMNLVYMYSKSKLLAWATTETSLQFEDLEFHGGGRYYEQFAISVVDQDGNERSDGSRITVDSQRK